MTKDTDQAKAEMRRVHDAAIKAREGTSPGSLAAAEASAHLDRRVTGGQ